MTANTTNGDSYKSLSANSQARALRASLSSIIIPQDDRRHTYRNWARSYTSTPATAFLPSTEEECAQILELARLEGQTVRAVGAGHSPSDLPCTQGFMIRMDKLDRIVDVSFCCRLF